MKVCFIKISLAASINYQHRYYIILAIEHRPAYQPFCTEDIDEMTLNLWLTVLHNIRGYVYNILSARNTVSHNNYFFEMSKRGEKNIAKKYTLKFF